MKSKNIPADIRSKSMKEAQSEINDIIEKILPFHAGETLSWSVLF